MKLHAHYCLKEEELDLLPKMKTLVTKAEQILSVYSLVAHKDLDEFQVDVEPTDYSDQIFGIRIYLGELGGNKTVEFDTKDVKSITCGENWMNFCLEDNTTIQFVYVSGLVLPKQLPA